MKILSIEYSTNKNRQLNLIPYNGNDSKLEAMKICEFLFAYVPSGNYKQFVSMIVDKMDFMPKFSKQLKEDIMSAIENIADEFEELNRKVVMPVLDNMTEEEWEEVLARPEPVESN